MGHPARPLAPAVIPIRRPDFDEAQLRDFLSINMDPAAGAVELRVLHATFNRNGFVEPALIYAKTLAGWYDDPSALVVDAARLKGISGYVTVNPVRRDLLARSYNRLAVIRKGAGGTGATTRDEDIACLRWVFVDIDPVRPADISSTDAELAAAIDRRDLILSENPDILDSAFWGRSGNGCWVLIRLPDLANDDRHRAMVARYLGGLAARYSDERVKIDPTTKNPSRIMACVGTLKCKGSNVPDRPHRLATIDGGFDGGAN